MPHKNLTVKISAEYKSLICNDYVQRIKNKARECRFPLGIRIVFPDGQDACMICPDNEGALAHFNDFIDNVAAKARKDVAKRAEPVKPSQRSR